MGFHSELSGGDTLMVASIASVNAGLSAPISKSSDSLKHQHTRELMNIQEHDTRLSWAGFQQGT